MLTKFLGKSGKIAMNGSAFSYKLLVKQVYRSEAIKNLKLLVKYKQVF